MMGFKLERSRNKKEVRKALLKAWVEHSRTKQVFPQIQFHQILLDKPATAIYHYHFQQR